MRQKLFLSLAALAAPVHAAQEDRQIWLQTNVQVPLDKKWRITGEAIARFSDRQNGLYQTEFGGLLSYKAAPHIELGFGYRHVGSHGQSTAADEERLRQQIVGSFGHVTARLRVDERFHPQGSEIGFRIRPLLRYTVPVGDGFALFASHESFFLPNSTRWGQRAGYERMRNSAGVVVPLAKRLGVDIAYLNQYRFARGASRATMDHILSLQLSFALAPHKVPHTQD